MSESEKKLQKINYNTEFLKYKFLTIKQLQKKLEVSDNMKIVTKLILKNITVDKQINSSLYNMFMICTEHVI